MRVLAFNASGDIVGSRRWNRGQVERARSREGLREKIGSRSLATRIFSKRNSLKRSTLSPFATANMSLTAAGYPIQLAGKTAASAEPRNVVIFEVGPSGDTWRYCVERDRVAERSEVLRAMLLGPFAPDPSDPPPTLRLEHVDKRAFNCFLKYLYNETINFQSVSTARATLDVAHQYLCPELAQLAVTFLEKNLNSWTVLEIYQGLSLYASEMSVRAATVRATTVRATTVRATTAPSAPGDDATQISSACTRLLLSCLTVIDSDPAAVVQQERFEELEASEISQLVGRDTLRLASESILFAALDRWAAAECRRQGLQLTSANKRAAIDDEVWYSVRYTLMTDREFVDGPMASGILTSEESALIVSTILGHRNDTSDDLDHYRSSATLAPLLSRLSAIPRNGEQLEEDQDCRTSGKPGKRERQDNRKNRRKECASQGQKTCARIGNCLVRVLACVFD